MVEGSQEKECVNAWGDCGSLAREDANEWGKCGSRESDGKRESERKRVSLCSSEIILAWVWDGLGAFSKEPFNFPSFHGLLIGLHPRTRLTGLFGQALLPVHPQPSGIRGVKGRMLINPLGREMLWSSGGWLSLPGEQTGSCSPVYSAQCWIPFALFIDN